MTFSRLFIDNDVFILLAGCGLLNDLVEAFGVEQAQCFRLPTLPFVIRNNKKIAAQFSEEALESASAACEKVAALAEESDATIIRRLQEARGRVSDEIIDGGEAILFAALIRDSNSMILTGDKRSLRVFATSPELTDLRAEVAGRVLCLEKMLEVLVRQLGAAHVAEQLAAAPLHKTVRIIFSPGVLANPGDLETAITSYLSQLRGEVGTDFLYDK